MKLFVLGLDCAVAELLFGDERLANFRRLMEGGSYGRLESVVPPITVPAWMCLATSQDPGSLGVYGFRNRADYSYGEMAVADSRSIAELAIWDQLARQGKRSVIVGVPPNYPPRKLNGISVGCLLTPDTAAHAYTHPAAIGRQIEDLVGEYPVDVKDYRTPNKDWLQEEIYRMSRKQFEVVRHLMQTAEWDYFQFVEIGLDRMQHGFWKCHDASHPLHRPGNRYQHVIRDYYRHLDDELGRLLDLLPDDTAVLVASDHGAQPLEGGFCINDWLMQEGLLALSTPPREVTPFDSVDVDWSKTKAFSEGGFYARVFLNVQGREPQGTIAPDDCEKLRDELKAKLEATVDVEGRPLGTVVYKPEEIYRTVRGIPPDLIVYFAALRWRSIGSVGHPGVHVRENDTGPDDCNHSPFGAFILAATNNPLRGELHGVRLLDLAPTLLELGGYDVPSSMQGTSLVANQRLGAAETDGFSVDDERLVSDRLRGLGYL